MNVDQYISSGVLELYAAHALPPEEMREVEDMAARHPRVRAELDAITEGLKKYAEVYAPNPSQDLYDKILKRIQTSVPEAAPPAAPEPKAAAAPAAKPEPQKQEREKIRKLEPSPVAEPSARFGNGRMFMLIAASLLLFISVGINFYLYNKNTDTENKLAALQSEKNVMVQNENAMKAKFDETEQQLKLFTDPHNKMVMMKGMPISPASEVMVMWNTSNKEVYVDVHKLPAPPDGMQYQLWAIDKDGKPVDAGMMTPYKEQKVHGPQPMKKIDNAIAFAITLEHRGGSPVPTMDKMYVKGEV